MSLADELKRLAELHDSGALNADEFALAKQRLLAAESEAPMGSGAITAELARLREGQELAALDREWELDRRKHLVAWRSGDYGPDNYSVPTKGMATVVGTLGSFFGVFWAIFTGSMASRFDSNFFGPGPQLFPLLGIVIIGGALAGAVYISNRADAYVQAEARYRARRATLLRQLRGEEESPPGVNGLPRIETHEG